MIFDWLTSVFPIKARPGAGRLCGKVLLKLSRASHRVGSDENSFLTTLRACHALSMSPIWNP
jgi:hypothetical protein